MGWFVYLAQCADDSLYTGITTDLVRREIEHNGGTKGAKYTRIRRPIRFVYSETWLTRSEASQREYAIKKLTRKEKKQLYCTESFD
jgi:putative endonuclease